MKLNQVAPRIIQNFQETNWPNAVLLSGTQGRSKDKLILNILAKELYDASIVPEQRLETISSLIHREEYPDIYIFPKNNIKIGDRSKPEKKTIRHLLHHFIPYSPRNGKIRFILFMDASLIGNEAESALLKVMEEPPKNTHFILCAEEKEQLKDTISSRCIEVPYRGNSDSEDIPSDPWERFWYLSGFLNSNEYNIMLSKKWDKHLKEKFDQLSFSSKDFLIFDQIGISSIKKYFPKETADMKNKILLLSFMPLYYSLRDNLLEGMLPTIGPIRISQLDHENLLRLMYKIQSFFSSLRNKYYGTIPVNTTVLCYSFLANMMRYWKF